MISITAILTAIIIAFSSIFTLIYKYFKNEQNAKIIEIKNEQMEITNQGLEEQIDDTREWKKTSNYLHDLSPAERNDKLQQFQEAERAEKE